MSVAKNPITGDSIQTKLISEQYRNNYDSIFGKKTKIEAQSDIDENHVQYLDLKEHDK